MNPKREIATLVIAVVALILSVGNAFMIQKSADRKPGDVQYVMYLGTNDKDTNEPVCTPDEAKARAEEILVDHFGGYTIQEANGGWKDGETIYREYSLVIYLSDTTLDEVHSGADDLIKAFNQSSVMIQTNESNTEFYSLGN